MLYRGVWRAGAMVLWPAREENRVRVGPKGRPLKPLITQKFPPLVARIFRPDVGKRKRPRWVNYSDLIHVVPC